MALRIGANTYADIAAAKAAWQAGDTVTMEAGTYTGANNIGQAIDKAITLVAEGTVILDGTGTVVTPMMSITGNGVTLEGLTFHNATISGNIQVPLQIIGNSATVDTCHFVGKNTQGPYGVDFGANSATTTDITLRDCDFTGYSYGVGVPAGCISRTVRNVLFDGCTWDNDLSWTGRVGGFVANIGLLPTPPSQGVGIVYGVGVETTPSGVVFRKWDGTAWNLLVQPPICYHGISAQHTLATPSTLSGLIVRNCRFENLPGKGFYLECCTDFLIEDCVFDTVGCHAANTWALLQAPGGIDFNQKATNCWKGIIRGNAFHDVGLRCGYNGAAIQIKARNEAGHASYGYPNGFPGYLRNIEVVGNSIDGATCGIRVGECNFNTIADTATPDRVVIHNNRFENIVNTTRGVNRAIWDIREVGDPRKDGTGTTTAYGSVFTQPIDARFNWFGGNGGPTASFRDSATGDEGGNGLVVESRINQMQFYPWAGTTGPVLSGGHSISM